MVPPLEKSSLAFLIKINIHPYYPEIPSLGIYPREMKICLYKDMPKYVCDSFIYNSPNWQQLKCLSVREHIRLWFIHGMECYPEIKRNNILIHTTSNVMIFRRIQIYKSTYCIDSIYTKS